MSIYLSSKIKKILLFIGLINAHLLLRVKLVKPSAHMLDFGVSEARKAECTGQASKSSASALVCPISQAKLNAKLYRLYNIFCIILWVKIICSLELKYPYTHPLFKFPASNWSLTIILSTGNDAAHNVLPLFPSAIALRSFQMSNTKSYCTVDIAALVLSDTCTQRSRPACKHGMSSSLNIRWLRRSQLEM